MGTKVYNDLPLEVKLSIFMGAKVCNDLLLEVGKILNFSDSEKFINILTSEPLLLGFYCYCWRCLARARTNIKKKTRRKLYIIVIDKACEKLAKFEVSFSDRHWLSACFGFCIYRNIDRKRQTYRWKRLEVSIEQMLIIISCYLRIISLTIHLEVGQSDNTYNNSWYSYKK